MMCDHSEPDILDCEVKWVLGSITMNKASGGDGIPAELFQAPINTLLYIKQITNDNLLYSTRDSTNTL